MKKDKKLDENPDIFGNAIRHYFETGDKTCIIVHSPDFDDDEIEVSYLFRNFKEMPILEKEALQKCNGKVLDVGCGAGSHALFLQQESSCNVYAIDISPGAVDVAKKRGLNHALIQDFYELKNQQYDTLLFLMNGSGIIGKLENFDAFFTQCKTLLSPNGKILMDSTELSYLFDEEEDGGIWVDPDEPYYGEMRFRMSYAGESSSEFDWLYVGFSLLQLAAEKNGYSCRKIMEGAHYDYLAELKPI